MFSAVVFSVVAVLVVVLLVVQQHRVVQELKREIRVLEHDNCFLRREVVKSEAQRYAAIAIECARAATRTQSPSKVRRDLEQAANYASTATKFAAVSPNVHDKHYAEQADMEIAKAIAATKHIASKLDVLV